jgi:hypothetical protein
MVLEYTRLYGNGIYSPDLKKGVILFGGMCSGKTTLAYELVRNHGFLHIGDDCIAVDARGIMSWGSMHLGGNRIALRHREQPDHAEVIDVPGNLRLFESTLDLGIYISRTGNPVRGNGVDGTMDTWHYLENKSIPVERLDIRDCDISKSIEELIRKIK